MEGLKQLLVNYDDQNYIVDGFRNGFMFNFEGKEQELFAKNTAVTSRHRNIIEQKIREEMRKGRFYGPFPTPFLPNSKISPLDIRPKKEPGSFRLIHNLSYPYDESSLNFNIPEASSTVKYETINDAIRKVRLCSPSAYMAKADIAEAYRLIPLHPSQYHLVGFSWEDKIYYDKCLPMGASSSCQIFERFSSSLKFILQNKYGIENVTKILDDFLFVNNSKMKCSDDLNAFLDLCKTLNIPLASHKTVFPTNIITFLGIEIDSVNMTIQLPKEKLQQYKEDVNKFMARNTCKMKELKSITGKLQFATTAIPAGRSFLRRLYNGTRKHQPRSAIAVSKGMKDDLRVWTNFLNNYNGKTIISERKIFSSHDHTIWTDSSMSGFGGTFHESWIKGTWPTSWKKLNITILELYPIYILVMMYEKQLFNSTVIFYCDNEAVVAILNSQTSKCNTIMAILRPLVFSLLINNINFKAVHISGVSNTLCDCISRQKENPGMLLQYNMNANPSQIPAKLLPENFSIPSENLSKPH